MAYHATGIYYCQKEKEDKTFETFCNRCLPPGFPVKEIKSGQLINLKKLMLVILLNCVNRQNRIDEITNLIKTTMENVRLEGIYLY